MAEPAVGIGYSNPLIRFLRIRNCMTGRAITANRNDPGDGFNVVVMHSGEERTEMEWMRGPVRWECMGAVLAHMRVHPGEVKRIQGTPEQFEDLTMLSSRQRQDQWTCA